MARNGGGLVSVSFGDNPASGGVLVGSSLAGPEIVTEGPRFTV